MSRDRLTRALELLDELESIVDGYPLNDGRGEWAMHKVNVLQRMFERELGEFDRRLMAQRAGVWKQKAEADG